MITKPVYNLFQDLWNKSLVFSERFSKGSFSKCLKTVQKQKLSLSKSLNGPKTVQKVNFKRCGAFGTSKLVIKPLQETYYSDRDALCFEM